MAYEEYLEHLKYRHYPPPVDTKVITWDGNLDGKYILSGEINYVLLSDNPIDIYNEKVKRIIAFDGGSQTIFDTIFVGSSSNESGTTVTEYIVVIAGEHVPIVLSIDKQFTDIDGRVIKKGVYSLFFDDNYVSLIETETIHQIDQKCMQVGIPVVELTTPYPDDGTQVPLTDTENAKMTAAAKSGLPIVVKFIYDGGYMSLLFNHTSNGDLHVCICQVGDMQMTVFSGDGINWMLND